MSQVYELFLRVTFALFLMAFSFLSLHAATVDGLYEATVPIDSSGSANSKQVLREGMLQVLIKVTGNREVAEHPNVKLALSTPENFLVKYTQKVIEISDEDSQNSPSNKTKKLVSVQNYSFERILDLLKISDIPAWGKQRPLTLAWIAIELEPQNRIILNESDVAHFNNIYRNIVSNEASKRGVPLAYPLQDLEEQLNISTAAVWAQFPEELRTASQRYGADIIIAASLQAKNENTWYGKWKIITKDSTVEFVTEGSQLTIIMRKGINLLADNLAKMYTTHLAAPTELVKIKIEGVDNLSAYNRLEKYLTSLSVVDDVKVLRISKSSVEVAVKVKQGRKNLLTTLELDSKLVNTRSGIGSFEDSNRQALNTVENAAHDPNVIKFRWRS